MIHTHTHTHRADTGGRSRACVSDAENLLKTFGLREAVRELFPKARLGLASVEIRWRVWKDSVSHQADLRSPVARICEPTLTQKLTLPKKKLTFRFGGMKQFGKYPRVAQISL